jgi:hypothetical protein
MVIYKGSLIDKNKVLQSPPSAVVKTKKDQINQVLLYNQMRGQINLR